MPRTELDRRLAALVAEVLEMGEAVDRSIAQAIDALSRRDEGLAAEVAAADDAIDAACNRIERDSTNLITLHHPVVRDLRAVLAALSIAEDLERIGDHAEGIARLVSRLPGPPDEQDFVALSGLAALARVQLHGSLDAYRACDATRAREVWAGDDAVNALYDRIVRSLMAAMSTDHNALLADTYLLWIAHGLERIADRATNICERVIFIATGDRRVETNAVPEPVAS
ncbi:MAG TPA: phosphate signaling complex protein PhoU [Chloroflexota bacterium]|nr:phosphate signaling complex protein PhoU [Chloroflexota bacterium]